MELRGLEPLTPTLPGTGTSTEQAVQGCFWPVVGVVEVVTVVRVLVKIVVGPDLESPARRPFDRLPAKGTHPCVPHRSMRF